ncbi:MAG: hypothetical protein PHW18_01025 [Sulfuricurvum sp.]|uniref:hypothetical protein n=1 Tax=Sulfuricurvum sp. TaxID=2025608 RepID=UPI00262CFC73|nr:hypothetical protein [Sulfuricurvum sp.]MDD2828136.1 hypothetical protein [Sulfuricurvum sp.]MDD4947990.1 hypothetical protein [Sulfuricurvum sp.]
MKKTLSLMALAFAVVFSGCSATAPKVDGGAPIEKMVATYKIGEYVDVETAKAKLIANGFEVVSTSKQGENGTTILYTNAAMKADANKPMRGFAAVGRILVDDERKQVHIANPIYFGAAFMQDQYNHKLASTTLASLEKAFGPLKNSEDQWEFTGLGSYRFMISMPYYQDMDIVGEGSTADLVARAKAAKGTVVQVGDDRYLAFVDLDKRTNAFPKKIGTQNGELLPWAVLIEGGQARALNAKYYIAVSYPLLDMGGFMGIMTIPDAVTKSLQKSFK